MCIHKNIYIYIYIYNDAKVPAEARAGLREADGPLCVCI